MNNQSNRQLFIFAFLPNVARKYLNANNLRRLQSPHLDETGLSVHRSDHL